MNNKNPSIDLLGNSKLVNHNFYIQTSYSINPIDLPLRPATFIIAILYLSLFTIFLVFLGEFFKKLIRLPEWKGKDHTILNFSKSLTLGFAFLLLFFLICLFLNFNILFFILTNQVVFLAVLFILDVTFVTFLVYKLVKIENLQKTKEIVNNYLKDPNFNIFIHRPLVLLIFILGIFYIILLEGHITLVGEDTKFHALQAMSLIVDFRLNTNFFELETELYPLNYHFIVALFSVLFGINTGTAMVFLTPFLLIYFILCGYSFSFAITRNQTVALISTITLIAMDTTTANIFQWGGFPWLLGCSFAMYAVTEFFQPKIGLEYMTSLIFNFILILIAIFTHPVAVFVFLIPIIWQICYKIYHKISIIISINHDLTFIVAPILILGVLLSLFFYYFLLEPLLLTLPKADTPVFIKRGFLAYDAFQASNFITLNGIALFLSYYLGRHNPLIPLLGIIILLILTALLRKKSSVDQIREYIIFSLTSNRVALGLNLTWLFILIFLGLNTQIGLYNFHYPFKFIIHGRLYLAMAFPLSILFGTLVERIICFKGHKGMNSGSQGNLKKAFPFNLGFINRNWSVIVIIAIFIPYILINCGFQILSFNPPQTSNKDLKAFEWIKMNTPEDAVFFVGRSDAGHYIPLSTGRKSFPTPQSLFAMSSRYLFWLQVLSDESYGKQVLNYILETISNNSTFIYIGESGAITNYYTNLDRISVSNLMDSSLLQLVYNRGEVHIFKFIHNLN